MSSFVVLLDWILEYDVHLNLVFEEVPQNKDHLSVDLITLITADIVLEEKEKRVA